MVKSVASKVNDQLYDEATKRAGDIGLKNVSQMVRYSFAIVCGYSSEDAKIMALISPDTSYSDIREGE